VAQMHEADCPVCDLHPAFDSFTRDNVLLANLGRKIAQTKLHLDEDLYVSGV